MTSENQPLLDSIRLIVTETVTQAIAPLTERVDSLAERSERIEAEQRDQRTLLNAMSMQVGSMALHVARHDSLLETIDSRTNQIESDLFDVRDRLRQVGDRVRDGFHGLKHDLSVAFSDIRATRKTQSRHDRVLAALRDEQGTTQRRLSALEGSQG